MLVILMRLVFCLCDYDCTHLFLIFNSDKLILSVESRQINYICITICSKSKIMFCNDQYASTYYFLNASIFIIHRGRQRIHGNWLYKKMPKF